MSYNENTKYKNITHCIKEGAYSIIYVREILKEKCTVSLFWHHIKKPIMQSKSLIVIWKDLNVKRKNLLTQYKLQPSQNGVSVEQLNPADNECIGQGLCLFWNWTNTTIRNNSASHFCNIITSFTYSFEKQWAEISINIWAAGQVSHICNLSLSEAFPFVPIETKKYILRVILNFNFFNN